MPSTKPTPPTRRRKPAAAPVPAVTPVRTLARHVGSWANTLIGVAGSATDIGMTLAQARVKNQRTKAALGRAGTQLRKWREAAGLTVRELGDAVGLGDERLIEEAEAGTVGLPFELLLRLAAVLGRHDPIPVAMALTRQYNPQLWKTLEGLGVGRLAVQGTRERELSNIYRASDAARRMDDPQFARVLEFTKSAFDAAVALTGAPPAKTKPKPKARRT